MSNHSFATRPSLFATAIAICLISQTAFAVQEDNGDRWVVRPFKVVVEVPDTKEVTVNETEFETKTKTVFRPVWKTETRQRKVVTRKPVVETRERLERQTFYRPEKVTRYRDREVKETAYRKVTKYRDETYTVRKPVVETEYREQKRTVRKPVTETMIEVKKTTSYKPVTQSRTEWVAKPGGVGVWLQPDPNQRPRLRYLQPGYYTDPTSGLSVYRRRGLHWTAPSPIVTAADLPPTLVPEEKNETRYVPEVSESRRPVDVTRMVESTETYRVPVEVERMVESTETRRVPYVVEEPYEITRVERVPYEETVYREEVVTKKVPYTTTVMKDVVTYEPYEIEVGSYEEQQIEERVPRTVRRKVTRNSTKMEERVINMKVKIDKDGNFLTRPVPLSANDLLEGRLVQMDPSDSPADQTPDLNDTNLNINESTTNTPSNESFYQGRVQSVRKVPVVPVPGNSILETIEPVDGSTSGTTDDESNPTTEITPAEPPAVTPSAESGDENAANKSV